MNNAAIAHSVTITRTKQGFESNFGANHLGHFLFTALLSPAILRATSPSSTDSPRIINLSSTGAHFAKELRWDDPNFTERPEEYERYVAYALSKYANIAFSKGLAKRLGPKGVLSFSLHPGGEFYVSRFFRESSKMENFCSHTSNTPWSVSGRTRLDHV